MDQVVVRDDRWARIERIVLASRTMPVIAVPIIGSLLKLWCGSSERDRLGAISLSGLANGTRYSPGSDTR